MTENLSSHFVVGFFANSPTQRRVSCPSTNGKNSWIAMSRKTLPEISMWSLCIRSIANSGVATTPTMLDSDALTIAPATLPPAIEVNAMDACTVEGTSVRKRIPRYSPSPSTNLRGKSAIPKSGKITKVQVRRRACSRQCLSPAIASAVERRAP